MLTGSVKQLVGKVSKVQQNLMHKTFALTFNSNTRNKQLDAEISGVILTENITLMCPDYLYDLAFQWLFL